MARLLPAAFLLMAFAPRVGDALTVEGVAYRFGEHPAAPGMPYGQTGRKGTVYQLLPEDGTGHAPAALKVFTQRFRTARTAHGATALRQAAHLPGLQVCRRTVLTPETHAEVLRAHPDLAYGVLMPWIDGLPWRQVVYEQDPLTPEQSLSLARALGRVLAMMEAAGLAHCDLSGANVLVTVQDEADAVLVDVEDLWMEGIPRPEALPAGSAGYAHRTAAAGLWGPAADRFAGAVLLAEILGWCDPRVRDARSDEQYFDPAEIHQRSDRCRVLLEVLRERWDARAESVRDAGPAVAELLERAWNSRALEECPTVRQWAAALGVVVEAPPTATSRATRGSTESLQRRLARQHVADAEGLLARGQTEAAIASLEKAHDLAPDTAAPVYASALAVRGSEHERAATRARGTPAFRQAMERALADYRMALELAPPGDSLHRELAPTITDIRRQLQREGRSRRLVLIGGAGAASLGAVLAAVAAAGRRAPTRPPSPVAEPAPASPKWEVISPANAARVVQLRVWEHAGQDVAFTPDGQILAAAGQDRQVRLLSTADGALVRSLAPEGDASVPTSLAVSADGQVVASGWADRKIRLWRIRDGVLLRTLEGHTQPVVSLAFSPDGQVLASCAHSPSGGDFDKAIRLWRVSDGTPLRTLEGHVGTITAVAFSPDGRTLGSASWDATVRLWNVSDGALRHTIGTEGEPYLLYYAIAFAPDGQTVIAGSATIEPTMRLWRVADGAPVATMQGGGGTVYRLAYTPDGQVLASARRASSVALHRVADGGLLHTLRGHTNPVSGVAVARNSRLIASVTGAGDSSVRLWGVPIDATAA